MVQISGHRIVGVPCYLTEVWNLQNSPPVKMGKGRKFSSPMKLISKRLALSQLDIMSFMEGLSTWIERPAHL